MPLAIMLVLPTWLALIIFAVVAVLTGVLKIAGHASDAATRRRNAELQRPKSAVKTPSRHNEDW
jgi:hypothetical protein